DYQDRFFWTTGNGNMIGDHPFSRATSVDDVAELILRSVGELGRGPDEGYVDWVSNLSRAAERLRDLPVAYEDRYGLDAALPRWRVGPHAFFRDPPTAPTDSKG